MVQRNHGPKSCIFSPICAKNVVSTGSTSHLSLKLILMFLESGWTAECDKLLFCPSPPYVHTMWLLTLTSIHHSIYHCIYMCIGFQWIGPVSDQSVRNFGLIIFFPGKKEKCSELLEMQNKHLMWNIAIWW